jgi:hypothetical protein
MPESGENIMPDTEVFLNALKEHSDSISKSLGNLHEKINTVHTDQRVMNEKVTTHIQRQDIHFQMPPAAESCAKAEDNEKKIEKHIEDHSSIVKKDIGGIIGLAIVSAVVLAAATYVASMIFGG